MLLIKNYLIMHDPILLLSIYELPSQGYKIENLMANRPAHGCPWRRSSPFPPYLRNGGDPYAPQIMLGYATMEMVKRYLSIAQADLDKNHKLLSPVDNWRL